MWLFGQDEQLYIVAVCVFEVCIEFIKRLNEDFINCSLIAEFMFAPRMAGAEWPLSERLDFKLNV